MATAESLVELSQRVGQLEQQVAELAKHHTAMMERLLRVTALLPPRQQQLPTRSISSSNGAVDPFFLDTRKVRDGHTIPFSVLRR